MNKNNIIDKTINIIKKISSKTLVKAVLFGVFFPTIIIWILNLLKKLIRYSWEITTIPIFPGLYITNMLEKIGIIDISAGHATPAIFLFYGYLLSIIFYFCLYLIYHYIKLKFYNKKFTKWK